MITIGKRPEGDFTDPLRLLSDCHRRIERFLGVLIAVTERAQGAALDGELREALEVALRYFKEAAPRHTSDEEESLFPRLRACGGARAQTALAAVESLAADHVLAEDRHRAVDALGRRWLAEGRLPAADAGRLAALLRELAGLYQKHIKVEDSELFPLAAEVLAPAELSAVGREMAARRGIAL